MVEYRYYKEVGRLVNKISKEEYYRLLGYMKCPQCVDIKVWKVKV